MSWAQIIQKKVFLLHVNECLCWKIFHQSIHKLFFLQNSQIRSIFSRIIQRKNYATLAYKFFDFVQYTSTWVFNDFGSKEFLANLVVPTRESNVKMDRLSENYPDMIKNKLVELSKHEKTSTKTIIRDSIKSIFTDPREVGNCNAEILIKNFPIIEACRGKTSN